MGDNHRQSTLLTSS